MAQATKRLRNWNDLTEEIKAPSYVIFAMAAGRAELMKLAPKGPAEAEEAEALRNVIRVLLETNRELQEHSQNLASQMKQLRLTLRGLQGSFDKLHEMASFTDGDDDESEDD